MAYTNEFEQMGDLIQDYLAISYRYCQKCKERNCLECQHQADKTSLDNQYIKLSRQAKGQKQRG